MAGRYGRRAERRARIEKRYDPRSYPAQGIDLESTTHHGASRSALEASGRGALHWSVEASREWDRITQSVESYLEVEHVGPVDVERVREVLEELRFEAGLTASDASPERRAGHANTSLGGRAGRKVKRRNAIPQRSCSSTPSRTHAERCAPVCGNRRGRSRGKVCSAPSPIRSDRAQLRT